MVIHWKDVLQLTLQTKCIEALMNWVHRPYCKVCTCMYLCPEFCLIFFLLKEKSWCDSIQSPVEQGHRVLSFEKRTTKILHNRTKTTKIWYNIVWILNRQLTLTEWGTQTYFHHSASYSHILVSWCQGPVRYWVYVVLDFLPIFPTVSRAMNLITLDFSFKCFVCLWNTEKSCIGHGTVCLGPLWRGHPLSLVLHMRLSFTNIF